MLASYRGSYANRDNAAHEICDDEVPPIGSSFLETGDEGISYPVLRPPSLVLRPREGESNGGHPRKGAPLGREEGSRGTFRKVPLARFW